MRTIKANKYSVLDITVPVLRVKKLSDCTGEELLSILDNNPEVEADCQERAEEDARFWEEELLSYICKVPGLDFNFGYPGNYMYFSAYSRDAYDDFFEACINTQHDFGLFPDDVFEHIKRAAKKADFYRECCNGYEDISDSRFEHLDRYMKAIFEEAKNSIFRAYEDIEDSIYNGDGVVNQIDIWAEDNDDTYYTDGINLYEY